MREGGGSSTGTIVAAVLGGCLVLLLCGVLPVLGGAVYWSFYRVDPYAYDWGNQWYETTDLTQLSEVSWGEIRLVSDPTNVYSSNSTATSVTETRERHSKIAYYGFDDTGGFYKVKTTAGGDGYVLLSEAEMEVYLGQVTVISDTASVYASNSTSSGSLETRTKGEKLDWYGFDATAAFYKVRTAAGADGYMPVVDAQMPW